MKNRARLHAVRIDTIFVQNILPLLVRILSLQLFPQACTLHSFGDVPSSSGLAIALMPLAASVSVHPDFQRKFYPIGFQFHP